MTFPSSPWHLPELGAGLPPRCVIRATETPAFWTPTKDRPLYTD
ncbi:hypothetical protein [Amycolatopsis sp.]|jgi:hypothetical protein|nr:hypothetical protein [Amycolatopsis sp.]